MPNPMFLRRRKYPRLSIEEIRRIDYKDIDILKVFLMDSGRIFPSRTTRIKKRYQRPLRLSIEHARFLALLPYCEHY